MGFQEMITFVPCMTDKVALKTVKRIISVMREKRTCRLHGLSRILCCLEVHWLLPSERPLWVLSYGETLGKHLYADLKLDHRPPNTQVRPFSHSQSSPLNPMWHRLFESSSLHTPWPWWPPTYTLFNVSWNCVLHFCSCSLQLLVDFGLMKNLHRSGMETWASLPWC